jgi:hypothetical protein
MTEEMHHPTSPAHDRGHEAAIAHKRVNEGYGSLELSLRRLATSIFRNVPDSCRRSAVPAFTFRPIRTVRG